MWNCGESRADGYQELSFVHCYHTCPDCVMTRRLHKVCLIIKRLHCIGVMHDLWLPLIYPIIKWNEMVLSKVHSFPHEFINQTEDQLSLVKQSGHCSINLNFPDYEYVSHLHIFSEQSAYMFYTFFYGLFVFFLLLCWKTLYTRYST